MSKTLRKEVWLPQSRESVWVALTEPSALAEWLMPNNFEPRVGHTFRFHVDPMPGFRVISECRVLEVEEPSAWCSSAVRLRLTATPWGCRCTRRAGFTRLPFRPRGNTTP